MHKDISRLKLGVLFFSFFSILSLPLGYLRNWLLSKISVEAVSAFALINILIGLISTFFIFGATNVYSTFLPKIDEKAKQFQFVVSSYVNSIVLMLVMFLIFYYLYPYLPKEIIGELRISNWWIMFFFTFFFGLAQVAVSALIGLREYKLSACLSNSQIFAVTTFLLLVLGGYFSYFKGNELNSFFLLIGSVWCIVFCTAIFALSKKLPVSFKWFLPQGYWSQAIFIHLGTILTFLYLYVDQIIVLSYLGANELAQYFLIVQIASLVTFIPIKLGNVFQSTFASLLRCNGKDENAQLTKQYHKVAKYTLLLTFSIALTFILFNKEVLGLFANKIALNNWWFSLLILRYFIGSLGNVHAMIIIAKEKNRSYFTMNAIMVLLQIILSVLFVTRYGILGIIIAFIITTVVAQINLIYLLIYKCKIRLFSMRTLGALFIVLCFFVALNHYDIAFVIRLCLYLLSVLLSLKILNVNIKPLLFFCKK